MALPPLPLAAWWWGVPDQAMRAPDATPPAAIDAGGAQGASPAHAPGPQGNATLVPLTRALSKEYAAAHGGSGAGAPAPARLTPSS